MKNNTTKGQNNNIVVYFSLLLAITLLLLDGLSGMKGVRNALSFVFEPTSFQANIAGSKVKEYFQTFVNLGNFRKEFNDLKIASYDKEAQYSNYVILKNENEALKKQIALGNREAKYVLANTLRDDNVDTLAIDQGSESGLQQGDVVTVGNIFVGIVSSVDLKGSTVRLPSDGNSHLEVVVLKVGQDGNVNTNILSSGVVSGSAEGIMIENIAMNSEVVDGDMVYINDSKVGGFYALGYVVALSSNPASTYKTAFVSPILDYDNLMQVFVRVE
jgi:cell shape-determining protein MreC